MNTGYPPLYRFLHFTAPCDLWIWYPVNLDLQASNSGSKQTWSMSRNKTCIIGRPTDSIHTAKPRPQIVSISILFFYIKSCPNIAISNKKITLLQKTTPLMFSHHFFGVKQGGKTFFSVASHLRLSSNPGIQISHRAAHLDGDRAVGSQSVLSQDTSGDILPVDGRTRSVVWG